MQVGVTLPIAQSASPTIGTSLIRPGRHTEMLGIGLLVERSIYHSAGWTKNINELQANPSAFFAVIWILPLRSGEVSKRVSVRRCPSKQKDSNDARWI